MYNNNKYSRFDRVNFDYVCTLEAGKEVILYKLKMTFGDIQVRRA